MFLTFQLVHQLCDENICTCIYDWSIVQRWVAAFPLTHTIYGRYIHKPRAPARNTDGENKPTGGDYVSRPVSIYTSHTHVRRNPVRMFSVMRHSDHITLSITHTPRVCYTRIVSDIVFNQNQQRSPSEVWLCSRPKETHDHDYMGGQWLWRLWSNSGKDRVFQLVTVLPTRDYSHLSIVIIVTLSVMMILPEINYRQIGQLVNFNQIMLVSFNQSRSMPVGNLGQNYIRSASLYDVWRDIRPLKAIFMLIISMYVRITLLLRLRDVSLC